MENTNMKAIHNILITLSIMTMAIGCGPSKQEQERQRQQYIQDSLQFIQDSLQAIEDSKPALLKVLEKVEKENLNISEFYSINEISNAIRNKYGEDYYLYLNQQVSDQINPINIERYCNQFDEQDEEFYSQCILNSEPNRTIIQFRYNIYADTLDLILCKELNNHISYVNPDGTFFRSNVGEWEVTHLENDEFGDPIKDKVFVSISRGRIMNSLCIAMMYGDENHIRFYYDLPWHPNIYNTHKIVSIKIKNQNDESIRELSNYKYNLNNCILSEEDSRYIKDLCDSDPHVSFTIRFETISYDWIPDRDDIEVTIFSFKNGAAYGLSEAYNASFYRAF